MIKRTGGKVYIEGVRKISWDTGEMCEFASALVSALLCLGERIPYHYIMGTSGVAFRYGTTTTCAISGIRATMSRTRSRQSSSLPP